ncbi:MAG: peptidoglycan-binding protein [Methylovirgula sp.]|uniref:peptidoglycan-binding protein n=1 Tax=Methylovirgula sp. TaxID=1978224 RepID=UPI0030764B24
MREALARSDNDFLVAEPRRRKPAARKSSLSKLIGVARFLGGVANYPNRVAGALLVAMAVAITVNALELQTTRHPAPLFGHATAQVEAASAIAPAPPARVVVPAPESASVPTPYVSAAPVAPAPNADPLGQFIRQDEAPGPAHNKRPSRPAAPHADPISQILHEDSQTSDVPPKPSRTVLGVQRALVKLGFVLEPDGIEGDATRKAITQFERDHHLPTRADLSPKVIRALRAESDISIP